MIAQDIVEPDQTEWASLIIIVRKKDGIPRFGVNQGKLNGGRIRYLYPTHCLDKYINLLDHGTKISKIDANSETLPLGFAQEGRERTSFTSSYTLFHFTAMLFKLKSLLLMFQQALNVKLINDNRQIAVAFLDSINSFQNTPVEDIDHAPQLQNLFYGAAVTLNMKKCRVFTNCIHYFGHVTSPVRPKSLTKSIDALHSLQRPTSLMSHRLTERLCYLFRIFVTNIASVAVRLSRKLLKRSIADLVPFEDR